MKKISVFIIIIISIFLIYKCFAKDEINYVSIGDSLIIGTNPYNISGYGYNSYIKNYLERNNKLRNFNNYFYNNSIFGLTQDIKNNRTVFIDDQEQFLKKVLRESDIVVISVGMDELSYNYKDDMSYNYQYFEKMYLEIIDLIKEVKKYTVNKVIYIGYYNPTHLYTSEVDEYFCYIKEKLSSLMVENDVIYLDIYEEIKSGNYQDNPNNHHLNTNGYLKIANLLLKYFENS